MTSLSITNANVHIWNKDMIYTYADLEDQTLDTLLKLGRGRQNNSFINNYLEYSYKGARVCLRC